jgi:hypothetical protein
MSKFRIIKTRQKVEEIKTGEVVQKGQNFLQSLASIGQVFGVKTQALFTISGLIGSIKDFINVFKKSPKSKYGLGKNDLLIADILKSDKGLVMIKNYIDKVVKEKPSTETPQNTTPVEQEQKLTFDPGTSAIYQQSIIDNQAKQAQAGQTK